MNYLCISCFRYLSYIKTEKTSVNYLNIVLYYYLRILIVDIHGAKITNNQTPLVHFVRLFYRFLKYGLVVK